MSSCIADPDTQYMVSTVPHYDAMYYVADSCWTVICCGGHTALDCTVQHPCISTEISYRVVLCKAAM